MKLKLFQLIALLVLFQYQNNVEADNGARVEIGLGVPKAGLDSVFPIAYGDISGTCFTLEIADRQYLITAKHIVPGIKSVDIVRIFKNRHWVNIEVRPISSDDNQADIIALAPQSIIGTPYFNSYGSGKIFVGQDVYFLGYPYGLSTIADEPAPVYFPFVKKAILSAIDKRPGSGELLYLDGHNNPGFSGGPVFYADNSNNRQIRVAGVISGYRYDSDFLHKSLNESTSDYFIISNTGIIIAYSVDSLIEAIISNPIGPKINREEK